MAGHVYRAPGERGWRVQVDLGRDPATGRRIRVRLPGRGRPPYATKREAEAAASAIAIERAAGRVADSRFEALEGFLVGRWLPAREARGLRPSTIASYRWVVEHLVSPELGGIRLGDLRAHHVVDALTRIAATPGRGGRPRSQRTVQLAHRVLAMALADAVRWGVIATNPAEAAGADLPRRDRAARTQPRTWEPTELAEFLRSTSQDRLAALWVLAATTGMRRGELCGLRWDDVDLDAGVLTVRRARIVVDGQAVEGAPKTNAGVRTVVLDPGTVAALSTHRRRMAEERLAMVDPPGCSPYVFHDERGRPLWPEAVTKRFRRLVTVAGVPSIRFHDLRHTAATIALAAGVPVEVIAARLGHSSSSVTRDIYLHRSEVLDRDAAARIGSMIWGAGADPGTGSGTG